MFNKKRTYAEFDLKDLKRRKSQQIEDDRTLKVNKAFKERKVYKPRNKKSQIRISIDKTQLESEEILPP